MREAVTIGISIEADWRTVYDAIWSPERFPDWASGLTTSRLRREGGVWRADGPDGPITIRFSDRNPYGVMDHWVDLGGGGVVSVPLRVVGNDDGAEVMLTLFRRPGMSDAAFAEDQAWVRRDLRALKALIDG